jgi:hypothetical protein
MSCTRYSQHHGLHAHLTADAWCALPRKPLSLLSQVFNTDDLPRHALAADVHVDIHC